MPGTHFGRRSGGQRPSFLDYGCWGLGFKAWVEDSVLLQGDPNLKSQSFTP